jgi:predicted DNA-binding protein
MAKIAAKRHSREGDQYMIRMPPGLRERVAAQAAANGRSISAEIVDAIEQYLQRSDRITQIWEFFERHRADIESVPLIRAAVENLEIYSESIDNSESLGGNFRGGLIELRRQKERKNQEAALPLITVEQAKQIRKRLKEKGASEERFLKAINKGSIEEIRDFDQSMAFIEVKKPSA